MGERFARFWESYPKKVGKVAALKSFKRATRDGLPPADELDAVLARHRAGRQWREGFVPNPATWLNQGRWNDEVEPERRPTTVGGMPTESRAPRSEEDRLARHRLLAVSTARRLYPADEIPDSKLQEIESATSIDAVHSTYEKLTGSTLRADLER